MAITQVQKSRDRKAEGVASRERDRPWLIRTYSGHSSAKASNALYRMNLEKEKELRKKTARKKKKRDVLPYKSAIRL